MEARAQARRHDVALDGRVIEPARASPRSSPELIFAADRAYMRSAGTGRQPPARAIILGDVNLSGEFAMSNGLSRLATRFLGEPESLAAAKDAIGKPLDPKRRTGWPRHGGARRHRLGGRVPLFLEERASFSPDGLTGMEANLRFAGPETMETKSSRG